MKKRTSSLPVLVIVAVIALVLGSFGTATAAGLTKGKVKKIATKVVKKQAPTLSVAFATNAGNATTLAGQPASAYQNPSTTFVLPTQAAASTRDYSFSGIAAGTYLVSYSVFMDAAAGNDSNCSMLNSQTSVINEGWSYGSDFSIFLTNNATTLLTVGATSAPKLHCAASTNWTIHSSASIVSRVTFTKV